MTRKDTILIAVLVNAGLLAILFATAVIYDDTDNGWDQPATAAASTMVKEVPPPRKEPVSTWVAGPAPIDEIDRSESTPSSAVVVAHTPTEIINELPQETFSPSSEERTIEVVVKKGDALDKIARANGVTVSSIKKANNLQNEKLKVGQVLKIPVSNNTPAPVIAAKEEPVSSGDAQYYTVKNGDSPWKIGKQFGVNFEDIVRLNGLDEEKARNLQPGDKIRVK